MNHTMSPQLVSSFPLAAGRGTSRLLRGTLVGVYVINNACQSEKEKIGVSFFLSPFSSCASHLTRYERERDNTKVYNLQKQKSFQLKWITTNTFSRSS